MTETTIIPIGLLVFGLIVIGLEILVMLKRQKGWGPDSSRIVGLSLVVVLAVFIVSTTSISQERLTAAIGLLGTIAGYLLGKTDKEKTT